MMTSPIDTWLARHWMDLAGNLEAEIDRLRKLLSEETMLRIGAEAAAEGLGLEAAELGFSRTHAIRARDSAVRANAQLNAAIARVRELPEITDHWQGCHFVAGYNFALEDARNALNGPTAADGDTDGTR